jgi:hypothetical protein
MKKILLVLLGFVPAMVQAQITTTVTPPASPTNNPSLVFSVVFGEAVEGFDNPATDLIIGGTAPGTLAGAISGTGASYTVTITGMTGPGTVTLQIPAGAAHEVGDPAGDQNTASTVESVVFDNVAPTVTINRHTGQADPTNVNPVLFTVVFSEPINTATFTTADVSTSFGTVASVTQVGPMDGTTFEVAITATGAGTIQPTIPAGGVSDPAGNTNAASTSTDNEVFFDNTSPTVTVNQHAGQADPTSVSPVLFTVVFSKPINVSTFTNSDVTIGGTATGTSASVAEVAPNNGTTFEISVSVTGAGTIIASLAAGVVSDPLGNPSAASTSTDNTVTFRTLPVVSTPTVSGIGSNNAVLGGTVVSDGAAPLSARGTVWSTASPVNAGDNPLAEGGTTTGAFSHSRSSLPSGTQIFFRAYATNAVGTGLSPEASFFTFSDVPGAQNPNFNATVNSATQITLNFDAYTSITNADGYVLLRRVGANPQITHVQDGVAPGSLNTGPSVLVATITTPVISFVDTGLNPGTDYRYALVPFNWNGTNPETYNYLQGAGPDFGPNYRATGITFFNSSAIAFTGGTTSDIDYAAHQTASGLTMGNSESLATFEIRDGILSYPDGDNVGTTLTSLTVSIANFSNVRTVALFVSGSNVAEASVSSGSVTFGSLSITANDNSTRSFTLRATFRDVVTDNQPITITITNAVASASGSGFAAPDAGGATTGTATNRIEVTATRAVFVSNPPPTDVNVNFGIAVRAVDALNNLDLDNTGNVTLSISGGNPGAVLSFTSPDLSLTKALVAGEISWSALRINLAGTYTITGNHAAFSPANDATGSVTINSLGVTITGPANQNFCFGGSFQPLTNIVISESDPGDFAVGSNVTYSIILPAGFEFNTAVTPTLSETGNNITALASTSPAYPASNIYRFQYTSSNINTPLDAITLAGLQVRYTGNTAVTGQEITRIGGSAIVAGSPVDTPVSHGTLSASVSPTVVSFTVDEIPGDPDVNPNETRFSVNSRPVRLIGSPAGGSFTGNGVVNTGGANGFTFNPSLLAPGTYPITYTYTDGGGCVVSSTTNFEVFASFISNLALEYCSNSAPSGILGVPQARIDSRFGAGTHVLHDFVYWTSLGWTPIPASGDPATTTVFNPADAIYNTSINNWAGVYIGYRVRTVPPGNVVSTNIEWQFIRVFRAPTLSFTLPASICAYDAPITLVDATTTVVNPRPASPGTDNFTGSVALQNPGGNDWSFVPANVPGASLGTPINITYNYRDPATACTNSITRSITVHARPSDIPASDIQVSGNPATTTVACQGNTPPAFTGVSSPGVAYRWYADAGLTDLRGTTNTFNPPVNTAVPGSTSFYVARVMNGCQSFATTLTATINAPAVVEAGTPQVLCSGTDLTLSGLGASVTNPSGVGVWTSISTTPGTFRDISSNVNSTFGVAATYTPSASEIANGSFTLRLTSGDPDGAGPCPPLFDQVTITINSQAQANAGPDITVCAGQPINLSGLFSGAATTATWSDGGRGGTLPSGPSGIYTPTAADLANGAAGIVLTLTTDDPPGPCAAASDALILNINQAPTVSAGFDRFVCQGGVFNIGTATPTIGGSAASAIWTVDSGVPGTFVGNTGVGNSFSLATFEPTAFGQTRLRITTNDPDGAGPCSAVSDDMILTTNQAAVVNAGVDNVFCAGQPVNLSGSTAGSTASVTWSRVTGTGGSFGNAAAPITTYNPTPFELANGAAITFRLTTNDPDGTDPITGPCLPAQDDVDITINQRPEVNAGPDQSLCADEPVNLSATLIGSAGSGAWSGGGGTFGNAAALATTYAFSTAEQAGNLAVSLTFTTNDSDGPGPCVPGTDELVITVRPVPGSPTITAAREYCVGDVILPLEAVGAPGSTIRWYRDAAIANLAGTGNLFFTGVPNTTASQTTFYATQIVNGCESNVPAASEDIIINPLPVSQFTESDFCLDPAGNGVDFVSTSTIPAGSVVRWGWSFGDLDRLELDAGPIPVGTHQGATTGSFNAPSHRYRTFGSYTVVHTAESDRGCVSSASKSITVEPIPEPNFQFSHQCAADNTRFEYTGTFAGFITGRGGYVWDFNDAGATSAAAVPGHRFSGPGSYAVRLTVSTDLGCTASRTKTVSILPVVTVTNGNPYTESFETAAHGWFSEGFTPRQPAIPDQFFNSWQVAVAGFPEINSAAHGSRIWITRDNTLGTHRNDERSVLNTPCLVINNTRPVVSFDLWNSTDERRDGAYMEVSTDNGVTWSRLGNRAQGLNWYDTDAIGGLAQVIGKELTGPIGQSVGQIGWSGKTGGWVTARLSLDEFGGNRIRLRYVFGSNPDQPATGIYDGFAIDNFSIDSRNRLVLVENFTNAAAPGAASNNDNFRRFQSAAAGEIVKVQYHTSFPGNDPIHAQSAVDLNARAAFYGVTAAPRGFIDGVSNAPFVFTPPAVVGWDDNTYNTQALAVAPVSMTVTPSRDNNNLNVEVTVRAEKENVPGGRFILFVGVLEGNAGAEQFVLRKFLPSAAGTPLPALTVGGNAFTANFSWPVDGRSFSAATPAALNLSVIAFVQAAQPNPATQVREVLQAAINTTPVPLFDNFTTGVEMLSPDAVAVYPNPVNDRLHIELPFEATGPVEVALVDQLGKRVLVAQVAPGASRVVLPASALASGIYILQLRMAQQTIHKKILVAH